MMMNWFGYLPQQIHHMRQDGQMQYVCLSQAGRQTNKQMDWPDFQNQHTNNSYDSGLSPY